MHKIIYENEDGGVSIITPASSEAFYDLKKGQSDLIDAFINAHWKEKFESLVVGESDFIDTFIFNHADVGPTDVEWGEFLFAIFPTDDEWVDFIAQKDVPAGKSSQIVLTSSVPSDRTFRNAWEKNLATIEINMPKARIIHMDKIRIFRDRELEILDSEIKKAEDADAANLPALRTERQSLRDIPQNFSLDTFITPQALQAAWPPGLPKTK